MRGHQAQNARALVGTLHFTHREVKVLKRER